MGDISTDPTLLINIRRADHHVQGFSFDEKAELPVDQSVANVSNDIFDNREHDQIDRTLLVL